MSANSKSLLTSVAQNSRTVGISSSGRSRKHSRIGLRTTITNAFYNGYCVMVMSEAGDLLQEKSMNFAIRIVKL